MFTGFRAFVFRLHSFFSVFFWRFLLSSFLSLRLRAVSFARYFFLFVSFFLGWFRSCWFFFGGRFAVGLCFFFVFFFVFFRFFFKCETGWRYRTEQQQQRPIKRAVSCQVWRWPRFLVFTEFCPKISTKKKQKINPQLVGNGFLPGCTGFLFLPGFLDSVWFIRKSLKAISSDFELRLIGRNPLTNRKRKEQKEEEERVGGFIVLRFFRIDSVLLLWDCFFLFVFFCFPTVWNDEKWKQMTISIATIAVGAPGVCFLFFFRRLCAALHLHTHTHTKSINR